MKNFYAILLLTLFAAQVNAQVGIGTVSPNSTLDVRGSFSAIYRSFSGATTLTANDYNVVFTGSSATTATLPDATTCVGRIYVIKNFSASAITPVLTVNTVSSQKIDGISSWVLDEPNEVVTLSSDGANWEVLGEGAPVSGGSWNEGGNSVGSIRSLGTISNYDLPFITNNTEKMRITSAGNIGMGSTAFSLNPEALLVYQNNASSFNVIAGKGNLNNYLQLNIQNLNGGTNASSDVVATADNGNELTNYVDMGMNSSGNTSGAMGGADDAYLYTAGNNFLFGTANAGKALIFLTGGTSQAANERMRIDGSGNMGIGTSVPAYRLHVNAGSNPLYLGGVQTGLGTDSLLTIINGVVRKLSPSALVTSSTNAWSLIGNAGTNPASNFLGTTDAQAFVLKEDNSQVGRFDQNSIALGSGATTNNASHSYALGSGANVSFNKTSSIAIGTNAAVSNDSSFAIGAASATSGQNSFSIGSGSQANSANSFAIGRNSSVAFSISSAMAIGNAATANSSNAIAIGSGATTGFTLTSPVAIGTGATANGSNSVAIGNGTNIAFAPNATALGAGSSVSSSGNNSTAVGYNTDVTKANEIILGDMTNSALSVGIGTESFSGSNREKLLVDAGATSSVNAIVGRGSIDSYLQLNIQNQSSGTSSSSDVVATANNGNETSNYVDMGVNGGNYTGGVMGAANDAYLYNLGQNFLIGTGVANKSLVFMTGGTSQASNERMRLDGSGNLGLGTNAPSQKLDVNGNMQLSGAFMPGNTAGTAGFLLMSNGTGSAPGWFDPSAYLGTSSWVPGGNTFASVQKLGTIANFDLPVITDNIERMRITNTGNVAIDPPTGVATFNATNPEKLLVDAGTTSSVNAIVGKGNNPTYLQLNIQNLNNGGNASSDVVATADNGNETTNYVDLGMNSSGNTSGAMGGADDAYLYTTGNNLLLGTANAKVIAFLTGGTTQSTNERMRIDATGNVGIGTNNPGNKLDINSGTGGVSGLRLKQLPAGAVLFMSSTADVSQNNSNFYFDATNYRLSVAAGSAPSSTLQVGGSMAVAITTKTANYTASGSDHTILCNNTAGAITISLPTAAGATGRIYVIKKISGAGNNVTVDGFGSETIDGSTTNLITTQYNSIMIQSDGANWYIISKN